MRLRPEQLAGHLQQSRLAPVYCLCGDEPLQILESEDAIRERARSEGVDERIVYQVERGFDWEQLARDGANLSLFSSRRLIELRLGTQKPGKSGGEVLTKWADKPDNDNILVITSAKLDRQTQQTRWFKALDKAGVIVQVWPVDAGRLPDWIRQRMSAMDRNLDRDAAELIAQRTEGNLLAARQELEKLCLLLDKTDIRLEDVIHHVVDSTRHDVFALIEYVLLGRTRRIAAMLRSMCREGIEPLSLFGALMWELRRLCSMSARIAEGTTTEAIFSEYRVWQQRQKAMAAALQRLGPREFGRLLSTAKDVERTLKGGNRKDPWNALEDLLFLIAGERLQFQTA